MHRIVIMGNAGAGKSTLATRLAREHDLAHLDLDTIAWQPGVTPPARAPLGTSVAALDAFARAHRAWAIEGCYADLLAAAAAGASLLVFLNPGVDACIAHCRARPWEPPKYASREAQDANLAMLIEFVRGYATRSDAFSLAAHRALFDGHAGAKREVTDERYDVRALLAADR